MDKHDILTLLEESLRARPEVKDTERATYHHLEEIIVHLGDGTTCVVSARVLG